MQVYHLPFLFSVTFTNIQSVPFPAVTVCPPESRKWSTIVEALNHVEKNDSIFEDFKLFSKPFKVNSFDNFPPQWTMLVDGAVRRDRSRLYHDLPAILNLLQIEKEVFYAG